jgi:alpha-tubulin suppressor-like RCC1 family protein
MTHPHRWTWLIALAVLLCAGCQVDLDEGAYDFACENDGDCSGIYECLPSDEYDTGICQLPGDADLDAGDTDGETDVSDTPDATDTSDTTAPDTTDTPDSTDTSDTADADDGGDTCTETNGGVEICDGLDNDCDGQVDEGIGFKARDIFAGRSHVCAVGENGGLFCWGNNIKGKAIPGAAPDREDNIRRPTEVPDLTITTPDDLKLALGEEHTCLVQEGTNLSCWGNSSDGRLGPSDNGTGQINSFGPTDIPGFSTSSDAFTSIEAGDAFTCARESDGAIFCWGKDGNYRMGDSDLTRDNTIPTRIEALEIDDTLSDTFALGHRHGCLVEGTSDALMFGGTTDIHCWGASLDGKTGDTTDDSHAPIEIEESDTLDVALEPIDIGVTALDLGGTFSCGFNSEELYCWGSNADGQLATDMQSIEQSEAPLRIELPDGSSAGVSVGLEGLATGFRHGCVLDQNDFAYCWGAGNTGQLGHGESGEDVVESTPQPVNGSRTIEKIVAGLDFTCAIAGDPNDSSPGQVFCWGLNDQHQLGLASQSSVPSSHDTPQPVACAIPDEGS